MQDQRITPMTSIRSGNAYVRQFVLTVPQNRTRLPRPWTVSIDSGATSCPRSISKRLTIYLAVHFHELLRRSFVLAVHCQSASTSWQARRPEPHGNRVLVSHVGSILLVSTYT